MAQTPISTYGFVADPASIRKSTGAQIAWDQVSTSHNNDAGKKALPAGTVVSKRRDGKVVPRGDKPIAISAAADNGSGLITVTATAHGLTTGDVVVVEGANEARFNGIFSVTVVNVNSFTYTITSGSSAASATGTLTASYRAYGVLVSSARQDAPEHAMSGYGVYIGGHFYENCLPDSTGTPQVLPAGWKDELAQASGTFTFEMYEDSRL